MAKTSEKARGKIKRAIVETAPSLAHALSGPLAGSAVSHIMKAIFGSEIADEETLSEALAHARPEDLIALKTAEQEFLLALRDADIEGQRIDAGDRASARDRQVKTGDVTPSALGALIIFGFFIVLAVMVTKRLPDGAETEFSIMLGALATMTAAVVNYFFGSSAGSKEKTRLLALPPQKEPQP